MKVRKLLGVVVGVVVLYASIQLVSCEEKRRSGSKPNAVQTGSTEAKASTLRDSIYLSPFGGYGYDIIEHNAVKIHQPNMPAVVGKIGFPTAGDARKVARLVMVILRHDETPPHMTREELKELGIK